MDLKDILSISGHPGLYRKISQIKNGIVAESLEDKKRMPVYAATRISALEDIAIFTSGEDVPITKVFKNIFAKENGAATLDPKSDIDILKKYFAEVLPDFDREKVYISDIKKVLTWYNILLKNDMLIFEEEKPASEEIPAAIPETETSAIIPEAETPATEG
ncbi:MAG: DUF5606 domain-containing protein [Bacteroidia bacterium]|nr:DUF5606 domain-containing protein [Bacteroidia bacterium]